VFFFAGKNFLQNKPEDFMLTRKKFKLHELMSQGDQVKNYIEVMCYEKLRDESLERDRGQYWDIPVNWFITQDIKEKNWRGRIKIASNKDFNKFGVINFKKNTYMAFHESSTEIARMFPPENAEFTFSRNPQTKAELFFIVKTALQGTTAYCFYGLNKKKFIHFDNENFYAQQDVILQKHPDYAKMSDKETQEKFFL
jgi:hypothetical protein